MAIREALPGEEDASYAAPPSATASPAGLPSAVPSASYWLQKPNETLYGFRSTPELPPTVDVAIVGSGITGAFAADALADSGLSVLLLEAREFCYGATGRNGGHCQPTVYGTLAEVSAFEIATFRFLRDFVAAHNVDCDWRTLPGGGVHAYVDADLFAAAAEAVALLKRTRPDLADLVHVVAQTTASTPTLDDLRLRHAAGAVVQKYAASVWPYKLVSWVLERLVKSAPNVNLQSTTPVQRLARTTDGDTWILHTPRGPVVARRVLLATNGYTSHLLPNLADLIVPVRGQVAALVTPSPPPPTAAVRLNYSYVFFGHDPADSPANPGMVGHEENDRDEYLVQQPFLSSSSSSSVGGHLILGGGRQRADHAAVGEWRDDAVEPQVASYLRKNLVPVLDVGNPEGAGKNELSADFEWTGIMAFSRDQFPWIGEIPGSVLDQPGLTDSDASGLYICAGYTGHGMPRAALAGRIMAGEIRASLGAPASSTDTSLNGVKLPTVFRMTAERVRQARASCDPVSVTDRRGLIAEFRDFLASQGRAQL